MREAPGTGDAGNERDVRLLHAGFADPLTAARSLERLASGAEEALAFEALLPSLLSSLSRAADPDGVLVSLERFSQSVRDRLALYRDLVEHARWLEILVTLFAGSQFLTEILLRQPDLFMRLVLPKRLAVRKPAGKVLAEALAALDQEDGTTIDPLEVLRRYQRLEFLRIGASDLLGLFDLETVTAELSNVADGLVGASLEVAARQTGTKPHRFAVIAMGKLGGGELNYSSDIDLLFVAGGDATELWGLAKRLIDVLARATPEGFLYRVDMRLRPWGEAGPLVSTVDSYLEYLRGHARLWERQALLKARVIAGDRTVGAACLEKAAPTVFSAGAEEVRREIRAMRELTERDVRKKGLLLSEVKLGEGSIRDVEFVVQFLQLAHGGRDASVRSGRTLDALGRLMAAGVVGTEEGRILRDGYVFLRTIEHHLQVMHYRQTHVLPSDPGALGQLARRLGFEGDDAGERFRVRFREHGAAIRAIYLRHLGGDTMAHPTDTVPTLPNQLSRDHMARLDPSYVATFGPEEIEQHVRLAEMLNDSRLAAINAVRRDDGAWRVTIVGWDYPGELSLICGLLFASGFGIHDAEAFTYEPEVASSPEPWAARVRLQGPDDGMAARRWSQSLRARTGRPDRRRKTIDVFTVGSAREDVTTEWWQGFAVDLESLLRFLRSGRQLEARGEIARRAARSQQAIAGAKAPLAPVLIEIDNTFSERYTVLRIDAVDTNGFLYELTNALAHDGIYISRMTAGSVGNRVHDTLWVADAAGAKITSPERQRELRAATVLIKHFTHLLPQSPNPESALLHFSELVGQLFSRTDWADELASLESPKVLDTLTKLLGVSDFLWSDFLRTQHENLFPLVKDADAVSETKGKIRLARELEDALEVAVNVVGRDASGRSAAWREALNAFKDRELFRVDMRHILGRTPEIETFALELTGLAEVVVETAFRWCDRELAEGFGIPRQSDGSPCPVVVAALGKFGGRELGFASDIELVFVHGGAGETDGKTRIGSAQYFEQLVQSFMGSIKSRKEGVFEIDLRLRPFGNAGPKAVSWDAFGRYFAPGGPAWAYERQSLIRLRPVAGDLELGRRVEELRDEVVYQGGAPDLTAFRAMRERQVRQLVTGGTFNLKYSPGGLVDVEYLVQLLQMRHGASDETLRLSNTRAAMDALAAAELLAPRDHERLLEAHGVLRGLIEALRVVSGSAMDVTMPTYGTEAFSLLARRLVPARGVEQLRDELERVSEAVREMNGRLLR